MHQAAQNNSLCLPLTLAPVCAAASAITASNLPPLPLQAYAAIQQAHPATARKVLQTLQSQLEKRLVNEVRNCGLSGTTVQALLSEDNAASLVRSKCADQEEFGSRGLSRLASREHKMTARIDELPLSPRQRQVGAGVGPGVLALCWCAAAGGRGLALHVLHDAGITGQQHQAMVQQAWTWWWWLTWR